MRLKTPVILAVALCLSASPIPAEAASKRLPLSPSWSADPIWDDGLAEIATYEATRNLYGASRKYDAVLIVVKEEFDAQTLVKSDRPGLAKVRTVFKLNAVRAIPTPNYDYRIMTSTFVDRDDPSQLVKLTSGSHEWCGNTWKAVRVQNGRASYDWSSYFDGEADGMQELGIRSGDLLEDQLPIVLRGLDWRPALIFNARLLPTFATSHAGPARWKQATFTVYGTEKLELPIGEVEAWKVVVDSGGRMSTWWFDTQGTHPLVQMIASDGNTLRLKKIERRAYWVFE